MKSLFAALGAVVFGAAPAQAGPVGAQSAQTASETPLNPKGLRMPPLAVLRAHSASERNDAVFGSERERLAWCEAAYALIAYPQASQRGRGARRVSNKARRHMLRLIDEVAHPGVFDA
jgi:hypothetical protein